MDFGAVLRMLLALIATLGILGLIAYGAKRFDILSFFNGDQRQSGAQPKAWPSFSHARRRPRNGCTSSNNACWMRAHD